MLYISRVHGYGKYFVADTDDGSEQLVTFDDLTEYVCQLGVVIKGVSLKHFKKGTCKINSVDIYQPPGLASKKQFEAKFLNGVEIKTNGAGMITSVSWDTPANVKDIRIRLSEYGTSCANYIITNKNSKNYNIVFVLDDNITITGKTFSYIAYCDARVDLLEVTNPKTAEFVYRSMLFGGWRSYSAKVLPDKVIDSPERIKYWQARYVLQRGANTFSEGREMCRGKELGEQIFKKFRKEFQTIAECDFKLLEKGKGHIARKRYVEDVLLNLENGPRATDFSYLYANCSEDIFHLIGAYTTCLDSAVTRFCNFLRFFDVPNDIAPVFVKFATRANSFLLDLYYRGE